MVKIKPSKEELERLYITEKISVKKLSERFQVAKDTVKNWIINYNIDYRSFGPRKISKDFVRPSKEQLNELYNAQKLTLREIGKKYNMTKTTVKRWFNKYGLKARTDTQEASLARKNISLPNKEQLIKDYEFFSIELIAKKYHVSTEPIQTLLDRYGIQKRNRMESKRLAEKTGRFVSWNKGKSMDDSKVAEMMKNLHKKHMEKIISASAKMSETKKRLFAEGKIKSWNQGKKLTLEHRRKLSDIKKVMFSSEEARAILRERGLKAPTKSKGTKPERLMKKILQESSLDNGLVEQYPLKFGKLATRTDFAYPEHKIAIYCDGEYWHGGFHHINTSIEKMKDGPRKERILKTMKKDADIHFALWKNGWVPLRFWQHEIEENPAAVINKIKYNLFNKDYIDLREEQRKELLELLKATTPK